VLGLLDTLLLWLFDKLYAYCLFVVGGAWKQRPLKAGTHERAEALRTMRCVEITSTALINYLVYSVGSWRLFLVLYGLFYYWEGLLAAYPAVFTVSRVASSMGLTSGITLS